MKKYIKIVHKLIIIEEQLNANNHSLAQNILLYEALYWCINVYLSSDTKNSLSNEDLVNISQAIICRSNDKKYWSHISKPKDAEYSMVANDGYYPTDWYKINVSGKGADDISLQETDNGYIMEVDKLSDVIISANNDDSSAVFKFSTSLEKVFIYETDEKTIGASVDTDNNGTFETNLNNTISESLGDVNTDGSITVSDVVLMQKYFIKTEKFNIVQYAVADFNNDGTVNIFDVIELKRFVIHN